MIKKRILIGFLLIASFSGMLFSQTLYDDLRNILLRDKLAAIELIRSNLAMMASKELSNTLTKNKALMTETQNAALKDMLSDLDKQETAIKAEIAKIKFKSIKLGGKIDFKSEKGTSIGLNMEYAWQVWTFPNFADLSPAIAVDVKKNDISTSYEATVGLKADFPKLLGIFYPYLRAGFGGKIPGGEKPNSAIMNFGGGFGFKFGPDSKYCIEPELLFSLASKPIYFNGAESTRHDLALNMAIRFNF